MTSIVCISDTHGFHLGDEFEIPDGDILIHAGDVTARGKISELTDLNAWFRTLPHKHKILIAGNHDFCFQEDPDLCEAIMDSCIYLQDESVIIEGIKFYGSPYTPKFFDWAFMLDRNGLTIEKKWDAIPDDTDVLITHGPPKGILDKNVQGEECGCEALFRRVQELDPKYHIFGHIHEGYGINSVFSAWSEAYTEFVNASSANRVYYLTNPPIVLEYKKESE